MNWIEIATNVENCFVRRQHAESTATPFQQLSLGASQQPVDPGNQRSLRPLSIRVLVHAVSGDQQRGNNHQQQRQRSDEQRERREQQRSSNEQRVASERERATGERWFRLRVLRSIHLVDERKRVQRGLLDHVDVHDDCVSRWLADGEATDCTERG